MKFDHSKDTIAEAVEGHEFDKDVAAEYMQTMMENPESIFGDRVTQTMETISENSENPEFLAALSKVIMVGIAAHNAMMQKAEEMVRGMDPDDLPDDMPEELKEMIRDMKDEPSDRGVDHELEELRKKYH